MKGSIAAIAATALLAGGGTFALWSQTQSVNGATITSGDLGFTVSEGRWFDTSQDRQDATQATGVSGVSGQAITDIASHKISPGDTYLGVFDIDAKLSGENMTASLLVTNANGRHLDGKDFFEGVYGGTDDLDIPDPDAGYAIDYLLADKNGNKVGDWADSVDWMSFASADNGHNVSALPVLPSTALDGVADYKLAVRVRFDRDYTERTNAALALQGMKFALIQKRIQNGEGGYKS